MRRYLLVLFKIRTSLWRSLRLCHDHRFLSSKLPISPNIFAAILIRLYIFKLLLRPYSWSIIILKLILIAIAIQIHWVRLNSLVAATMHLFSILILTIWLSDPFFIDFHLKVLMNILTAWINRLQIRIDLSPWILLHHVATLKLVVVDIVAIELVVASLRTLFVPGSVTVLQSLIWATVNVRLLLNAGRNSSLVLNVGLKLLLALDGSRHF